MAPRAGAAAPARSTSRSRDSVELSPRSLQPMKPRRAFLRLSVAQWHQALAGWTVAGAKKKDSQWLQVWRGRPWFCSALTNQGTSRRLPPGPPAGIPVLGGCSWLALCRFEVAGVTHHRRDGLTVGICEFSKPLAFSLAGHPGPMAAAPMGWELGPLFSPGRCGRRGRPGVGFSLNKRIGGMDRHWGKKFGPSKPEAERRG